MPDSSTLTTFTSAALRKPGTVGAIAPSSPRLARRMADVVPGQGHPTVVELGPGTGAVTRVIAAALAGRGTQLALEVDRDMVTHLRRVFPHVQSHHADAAELAEILLTSGLGKVDAVVSGLPWTLFGHEAQLGIIEQVTRVLGPGAPFTTFAYSHVTRLPTQRRFRGVLEASFSDVVVTPTVWRNLPPALCYQCRHPSS